MGIEIPYQPPPGPDCVAIFPPDEAPTILVATFSGIKKGDVWQPWMLEPLSGTWELTQRWQCSWRFAHLLYEILAEFRNGEFWFLFDMLPPVGLYQFSAGGLPPPNWSPANSQTNPAIEAYYDGQLQVMWS